MRRILIALWMLCAISVTAAPPAVKKPASSPPKKAVMTAPVVDVVTLKSGRTLRGGILQRHADRSVTMVVSRPWLQTANPELFAEYDAENSKSQREAWEQTRNRLQTLLATPPDSQRLVFYMQSELQQLEDRLAAENPKPADFLWIELPAAQVAKVTPAAPEHQRLAVIAWNEGFIDVEKQDAAMLQRELIKREINLDGPPPDLSSRLPARPQDDREWAARLAVIDYVHRQPLDFQGFGDVLLSTGGDRSQNLAAIFQKLMQQQMDSLLKDLLNDGPAHAEPAKSDREIFAQAITAAEAKGVQGFRVSRLLMEPERNRVSVEVRFFAKLGDDPWQPIFTHVESADNTQPRPDVEARIAQDPQMKAILESVREIGFIDNGPLQAAIRNGAATQAAMDAAHQAFFAFTNRYTQHVDRPKLFLLHP